jgi:hypothetical protein
MRPDRRFAPLLHAPSRARRSPRACRVSSFPRFGADFVPFFSMAFRFRTWGPTGDRAAPSVVLPFVVLPADATTGSRPLFRGPRSPGAPFSRRSKPDGDSDYRGGSDHPDLVPMFPVRGHPLFHADGNAGVRENRWKARGQGPQADPHEAGNLRSPVRHSHPQHHRQHGGGHHRRHVRRQGPGRKHGPGLLHRLHFRDSPLRGNHSQNPGRAPLALAVAGRGLAPHRDEISAVSLHLRSQSLFGLSRRPGRGRPARHRGGHSRHHPAGRQGRGNLPMGEPHAPQYHQSGDENGSGDHDAAHGDVHPGRTDDRGGGRDGGGREGIHADPGLSGRPGEHRGLRDDPRSEFRQGPQPAPDPHRRHRQAHSLRPGNRKLPGADDPFPQEAAAHRGDRRRLRRGGRTGDPGGSDRNGAGNGDRGRERFGGGSAENGPEPDAATVRRGTGRPGGGPGGGPGGRPGGRPGRNDPNVPEAYAAESKAAERAAPDFPDVDRPRDPESARPASFPGNDLRAAAGARAEERENSGEG